MLSSFFSRNSRSVPPLPPLDPPPSPEKRLEKEKAWLATISGSSQKNNKKSSSTTARQHYPAPIEHIKKDTDGLLKPDTNSYGRHSRENTAGSSTSGDILAKRKPSSIRSGFSSLRIGSSGSIRRKAKLKDIPPDKGDIQLPEKEVVSPISRSFVHIPLPSPNSYLSAATTAPSLRNYSDQAVKAANTPRAAGQSTTVDYATAKESSTTQGTKTLAERLQELESANKNGLLDDEEYRVLRQNLFESNVNFGKSRPEIPKFPGSTGREETVERTGTLLGLPRLDVKERTPEEAVPPPNPPGPPSEPSSNLLLPPSSDSIRSKAGRLSLRSSKSALTMRSTRLSSIFRRAASTPASESLTAQAADSGSLSSVPASILQTGKASRKGSKAPIPKDWQQLQEVHKKEYEREGNRARGKSADQALNDVAGQSSSQSPDRAYRTMRSRGDSRTWQEAHGEHESLTRSAQSNSTSGVEAPDYLKAYSSLPPIPSPSLRLGTEDYASPAKSSINRDLRRMRSDSRLTVTSAGSVSGMQTERDLSFNVVQPTDDALDSAGLKQAIAEAQSEKSRLVLQFSELEKAALAKHGMPATLGRRGSTAASLAVSSSQDERRRMSVSSSSVYSSTPGLGASRTSMISPHPPASLSRRPSKASSVLSYSSSTRRPNINGEISSYFYRPPSMLAEEQEDLFLESVVAEEDSPDQNKEIFEIRARRQNVEDKYNARIEYLEARLKSQLLKEKLRR